MNKISIKNRKATDKVMSVYWFTILFIVAAAVVYMVFSFYGEPYDIRELETKALANHIADCFSEGGYLKEGILNKIKEDFFGECNLNFDTEDVYGWKEQEQYYVEVNFLEFSSEQNILQIAEGNQKLKESCSLKGKNFPFCLERKFYTLDKDNNQYAIKILSVVRKSEKNAL